MRRVLGGPGVGGGGLISNRAPALLRRALCLFRAPRPKPRHRDTALPGSARGSRCVLRAPPGPAVAPLMCPLCISQAYRVKVRGFQNLASIKKKDVQGKWLRILLDVLEWGSWGYNAAGALPRQLRANKQINRQNLEWLRGKKKDVQGSLRSGQKRPATRPQWARTQHGGPVLGGGQGIKPRQETPRAWTERPDRV
jgi:hypothetical protein